MCVIGDGRRARHREILKAYYPGLRIEKLASSRPD
jgi:hypothetical protein